MPWNVVNKLEQICINFNKKGIEKINYKDLEKEIIETTGVIYSSKIDHYIEIMIKLKWIEKIDIYNYKIVYYKQEELF